ncbi:hypothetical protein N9901_00775 [Flavobacteriaceae bacterium]|nr:hypothetical protein [Flavobacteriaceae bacterium]
MQRIFSILISFVFLLQSFATVQAMPVIEGKTEMECMVKSKEVKEHLCCSVASSEKEQREKKNCCSGTSKMSCCIAVVAIPHIVEVFVPLIVLEDEHNFSYLDSLSEYNFNFFHPPILS